MPGLLLQVDVDVAVIVALGFVVDGGIGHGELLTDTGHKVRSLVDGSVRQCLLKVIQRLQVVTQGMVARGQRTVRTGYLVDITVVGKEPERLFGQLQVLGMFGNGLLGVGLKIGVAEARGDAETAVQEVHLLVIDVFGGAVSDDAPGTDVIQVVQVLGRVVPHLVGIDGQEGFHRLALQAHVVVIGGVDNGQLRLGIGQPLKEPGRQGGALLVDALQMVKGTLAVFIESTVVAPALAETHLLNFCN